MAVGHTARQSGPGRDGEENPGVFILRSAGLEGVPSASPAQGESCLDCLPASSSRPVVCLLQGLARLAVAIPGGVDDAGSP